MSSTSERFGEEAPHLPEAFQAARRAYGLASALLIAWEAIGIDFGESPVEGLKLTLKSPQAVPYILSALTLYFAFRFVIEWHQADKRRREMVASRVDYIFAHLLGAAALILYIYQSLLQVQVADLFDRSDFPFFLIGFMITVALLRVYRLTLTRRIVLKFDPSDGRFFIFVCFHLMLAVLIVRAVLDGGTRELLAGMILGVFTYVLVLVSSSRNSLRAEPEEHRGQTPNQGPRVP
jgi:lipid-A-disaccharide synthase-like uncharacterized protein